MDIAENILDWFCDRIVPWLLVLLLAAIGAGVIGLTTWALHGFYIDRKEGPVSSGVIVEKRHENA